MSFWRKALGLDFPQAVEEATSGALTFAVDEESIDPAVFGLSSYAPPTAPAPRIDRRTAEQVPAVKRSHDLVAGTLGGLRLDLLNPDKSVDPAYSLFVQPEKNLPRSVTMARLFGDLFYEEIAWWEVTEFAWDTYPRYVKRLHPRQVSVDKDRNKVYVDGREADQRKLIRFDSPTKGLLTAGARAIRTCVLLDSYAANAAQGIPPIEWWEPEDGADPWTEDEVNAFLSDWQEARRTRTTAWKPAGIKRGEAGWDPKLLQLAEQREHAVLEIARVAGIDPEDLGISTTSRTYANQLDRRKAFTDFTLGQFMKAVEDRLSMGDVCPRGYTARFNLDDFLRSDAKSRYEAYKLGKDAGALTAEEIREAEGKAPLTAAEKADNKPPAPQVPDQPLPAVPPLRSVQ